MQHYVICVYMVFPFLFYLVTFNLSLILPPCAFCFSVHIYVHFIAVKPRIRAMEFVSGVLGGSVDLKCIVNAKPKPKVIFWRDHDGRVPVILGNNYKMFVNDSAEVSVESTLFLLLKFSIFFLFILLLV